MASSGVTDSVSRTSTVDVGRLLQCLQQHRRSQPGEMEIRNDDDLAPSLARSPVRHPDDPAGVVHRQLSPGSLDLHQIRMNSREHPAACVAVTASPSRAQEGGREPSDELALLQSGGADDQVRMNRAPGSRKQLGDDLALARDSVEQGARRAQLGLPSLTARGQVVSEPVRDRLEYPGLDLVDSGRAIDHDPVLGISCRRATGSPRGRDRRSRRRGARGDLHDAGFIRLRATSTGTSSST